jgi:hypothetical protein
MIGQGHVMGTALPGGCPEDQDRYNIQGFGHELGQMNETGVEGDVQCAIERRGYI